MVSVFFTFTFDVSISKTAFRIFEKVHTLKNVLVAFWTFNVHLYFLDYFLFIQQFLIIFALEHIANLPSISVSQFSADIFPLPFILDPKLTATLLSGAEFNTICNTNLNKKINLKNLDIFCTFH